MRRIDVLIRLETKGHPISILVDAKFRKDKPDVKDIEDVPTLADSGNASKSSIVAANGWTRPAETKAIFCNMDPRFYLLTRRLL
jgi:Restriction endonuclease